VIAHEPAPVMCTRLPLTVHCPLAVKLTGKPDEAVALTVKSASPKVLFAKAANVSGDAGDFLLRQIPGLRHIRRDTVLDDGLERFIVRSLNELWLAKRRAAAAAAVDAVAKSAVTFEDELACGRIRLRRSLRR